MDLFPFGEEETPTATTGYKWIGMSQMNPRKSLPIRVSLTNVPWTEPDTTVTTVTRRTALNGRRPPPTHLPAAWTAPVLEQILGLSPWELTDTCQGGRQPKATPSVSEVALGNYWCHKLLFKSPFHVYSDTLLETLAPRNKDADECITIKGERL